MSKTSQGNYYKYKTKKYFKERGYEVEYLEKLQRIVNASGKVIWIKRDLFYSDLLVMNENDIILMQVKLGKSHVAEAFKKYWVLKSPPCVKKWIVVWQPRQEPEIIEVNKETYENYIGQN